MNHHGKIWQWQDILKETQAGADEKRLWAPFSLNQQSDCFLILTLCPTFNANTKVPKSEVWEIQSANNGCHHHIVEATEVSDEPLGRGMEKYKSPQV